MNSEVFERLVRQPESETLEFKREMPSSGEWESGRVGERIKTHRDLEVYLMAFEAAMQIFELTKSFPKEETYSLTDQIRRSSRSVCSNLAEAWRKRRYEAAFVSKLNDSEAEATLPCLPLSLSAVNLGSRYIERLGTGIRRMAQAMTEYDLPRPRFEDVGSEFRVTLIGPGERFMAEVGKRPAWAGNLNERQVEAVLYVSENGRITNREYQALCGISRETAKRDLQELVRKKLLTSVGSGRGLYYGLTQL